MKLEEYFVGNVRRDMLKISVISYKSSILPVHQLVLLNIFVFQISISTQHCHAQRHWVPTKILYGESLPQE